MNNLLIFGLVIVGFSYFGGKSCPILLKDNKEMILGVLIGLVICSFYGFKIEGFESLEACQSNCCSIGSAKEEEGGCCQYELENGRIINNWEFANDCFDIAMTNIDSYFPPNTNTLTASEFVQQVTDECGTTAKEITKNCGVQFN